MSDVSLPALRIDALTGREVIVAPDRAQRPGATPPNPGLIDPADGDPFLEGSESETPGEVLALRRTGSLPNQPGWLVRIVPNRYPALSQTPQDSPRASSLLTASPVFGAHDVVIEVPDRRRRLTDLSTDEFARVIIAWQKQVARLERRSDIAAVTVFRNEGYPSGASLPHLHSQILGTNFVPHETALRHSRARAHRTATGRGMLNDLCAAELQDESRVVSSASDLLILCPFAGRVAWQTRFVPQPIRHAGFSQAAEDTLLTLAAGILNTVAALNGLLGEFAFNLTLIQPPVGNSDEPWYVDLMPRTSGHAGFELATNVDIVTTAPEHAARQLRNACQWTATNHADLCPQGYAWQATGCRSDSR